MIIASASASTLFDAEDRHARAGHELPVLVHVAVDDEVEQKTLIALTSASACWVLTVGWARHRPSMQDALDHTLVGVVATDTREVETVGMCRATGDGRYYMIWDVIVKPAYQGKKIGTALVETALAEMRRRGAPQGAFVGLFTPKPKFYEQVGFRDGGGMMTTL